MEWWLPYKCRGAVTIDCTHAVPRVQYCIFAATLATSQGQGSERVQLRPPSGRPMAQAAKVSLGRLCRAVPLYSTVARGPSQLCPFPRGDENLVAVRFEMATVQRTVPYCIEILRCEIRDNRDHTTVLYLWYCAIVG